MSTILKKVKDSLKSKFIDMWKKSVASNNKLHVYSKIKLTFQREKYLSVVRNTFDRIAVTKLRISNHILPIETGRYKNIERK